MPKEAIGFVGRVFHCSFTLVGNEGDCGVEHIFACEVLSIFFIQDITRRCGNPGANEQNVALRSSNCGSNTVSLLGL